MTVASAPDSEALDKEAPLRRDIRLLGRILGDTIRSQEGHSVFELVEIVRKTAIRFHRGEEIARSELTEVLAGLSCEGMIPIILSVIFRISPTLRRTSTTSGALACMRSPARLRAMAR